MGKITSSSLGLRIIPRLPISLAHSYFSHWRKFVEKIANDYIYIKLISAIIHRWYCWSERLFGSKVCKYSINKSTSKLFQHWCIVFTYVGAFWDKFIDHGTSGSNSPTSFDRNVFMSLICRHIDDVPEIVCRRGDMLSIAEHLTDFVESYRIRTSMISLRLIVSRLSGLWKWMLMLPFDG